MSSVQAVTAVTEEEFEELRQKAYYATCLAGKEGMSGPISLLNLTQNEYDKLSASMNSCKGVASDTAAVQQANAFGFIVLGIMAAVSAITDALDKFSPNSGDVVIPICLGGTMLDEVVVNAQQRTNLRSGGR